MKALANIKSAVQKFHQEEEGLEALQVVMILAIAAVALIVIKNKWEDIRNFFSENTDKAVGDDNWATE